MQTTTVKVILCILTSMWVAGNAAAETTLIDGSTMWRQYHVAGPSTVRKADGSASKHHIQWASHKRIQPWKAEYASPPAPKGWFASKFNDSEWPRVHLPQPLIPRGPKGGMGSGMVTRIHQHDISAMQLRSKFYVKSPATVKGCTLSLDYWGGVIVFVNGKEVARGHMKGERGNGRGAASAGSPEGTCQTGSRVQ